MPIVNNILYTSKFVKRVDIILHVSYQAQTVKSLPAKQKTQVWSRIGKIPWRREWLLTPVIFPGEFHGQRSLVGYSPWSHKRAGHDWVTSTFTFNTLHKAARKQQDTEKLLEVFYLLAWLWWWYHRCFHMSKLINLYTLNMFSSLCINHTSINMF